MRIFNWPDSILSTEEGIYLLYLWCFELKRKDC